jgi:NADH:ubiquinone oxidoreductase subunit 6 (subunit J)
MPPLAATPSAASSPGQVVIAALLAAAACYWLLPRPRGRSVALGTFTALAAGVVLVSWVVGQFGDPAPAGVGNVLFWLFAAGAVGFAAAFVAQRNPARGAIAFAFVVVSVCGLFLTLAAPFLAAATVIIYAGAIVVTFLFVLMLSQVEGPSDENDRTREPLLGSLAAFAFLGLVLFAQQQAAADPDAPLPARAVTHEERAGLLAAAGHLAAARTAASKEELGEHVRAARERVEAAVGPPAADAKAPPIPDRLAILRDPRSRATARQAEKVRDQARKAFDQVENQMLARPAMTPGEVGQAARPLEPLRAEVLLLAGQGELPARNVANMGYALYADNLLAVEMAGTLLLVAAVGAVSIAGRRGAAT